MRNFSVPNSEKCDKLGKLNVFEISRNRRVMLFITICRMLKHILKGTCTSKAQYYRKIRKVKSENQYRKEVLESITKLININENVDDIVISGDFNEEV